MDATTVAVIDPGMGNLRSVYQAVAHAAQDIAKTGPAINVIVTADPALIRRAERVVLPGQGAMRDCMQALNDGALKAAILHAASTKPMLGVCVGMQMLLDHSEEQDTPGLGLIPGRVRRFNLTAQRHPDGGRLKLPQMGWNRVQQARCPASGKVHPMWADIPDNSWFYFLHSYYAEISDPAHQAGTADYGTDFTCAVARDNIFATQFHPEKSAQHGLILYRNFLRWMP